MLRNKKNFSLNNYRKHQSQRQVKASKLIMSAVVNCLRKGKQLDSRLENVPLTITNVNTSADLKVVDCYYFPFNTDLSKDELLAALEASKYKIRQYVTKDVNFKYSPEIRFYYDRTFEKMIEINTLLSHIK